MRYFRALTRHDTLGAFLLYGAAALIITWPLATVLSTRLAGHPFADSYEYIRHIWWIQRAVASGDSPLFQPLLAFPDGLRGAWLWATPLQSFPAWLLAFALPLPAAFNLSLLLWLTLNGWTMYLLARDLTGGRRLAALIAGLVFLAFPTMQGHIGAGHIGLLALWPGPLFLWALGRFDAGGGWRWLLLSAAALALIGAGSPVLLIYMAAPLVVFCGARRLLARDRAGMGRLAAVVGLGAALSLLYLAPIVFEPPDQPSLFAERGDVAYSADLLSIVTPSFYHPLFRHLPHTHQVLGDDPFERAAYIGIAAGLLAALALLRARAARPWLALAAALWIFSLGPLLKAGDSLVVLDLGDYQTPVALPWLALLDLPVIAITRTPARFNFALALALAVMAGYGAAYLLDRVRRAGRAIISGGLLVLILFEYQFWWPVPTLPGEPPAAVRALAGRDDIRAVFDVPWGHWLVGKDAMFLQTGHQHPMLTGHIARGTPVSAARLTVLEEIFDPALLDAAGVDVVIVHKEWDAEGEAGAGDRARAILGDPFYEDERLALFDVPASDSAPGFAAVAAAGGADDAHWHIHAPEAGWVVVDGTARGAGGRALSLALDATPAAQLADGGAAGLALLVTAGYRTITLWADPPCPRPLDPTLRCIPPALDAAFTFEPGTHTPVAFGRGVTLAASRFSTAADAVTVDLYWTFAAPITPADVRFVHLLDATGTLVAQADAPPGFFAAGAALAERVTLPVDAPGAYRLVAGWYTLPDVVRFPVPGSADDAAQIGSFTR